VDYAGDVAENRKQNINPELLAESHLQEHTQGWEQYGDDDTQQIHQQPPRIDPLASYYEASSRRLLLREESVPIFWIGAVSFQSSAISSLVFG
jgi:hypothetical protein